MRAVPMDRWIVRWLGVKGVKGVKVVKVDKVVVVVKVVKVVVCRLSRPAPLCECMLQCL